MADNLVEFTSGYAASDPVTLGAGEVHTLIPITKGRPGKVVVSVQTAQSPATYRYLKNLSARDTAWQIQGPITYRVEVRNAGCDYETGE